jgi:hemoglobin
MIPPRFQVTDTEIAAVVAAFYAAVRQHPVLGPVFAAHVEDWPSHEAKITRFWRNAILHERSYDGNPLAVHRAAGDVKTAMFTDWLALFDQTLARELPEDTAAAWSALAHRIGRGLIFGLGNQDGPPSLR